MSALEEITVAMLSNVWNDLRYTARSLRHAPGFMVTGISTIALGVGVTVAIFSLFQQILLRPLPVAEPDRLVNLNDPGPKLDPESDRGWFAPSVSGGPETVFSYPMFRDLERAQEPFVGIAAYYIFEAGLSTGENATLDTGMFVSGRYFSLLGLQPALGRLLGPQDDRVDGQAESVVLSHAYWQSEFDGDPGVVGRGLFVGGSPLTIVGVAPPGFHGTTVGARASIFVPITFRGVEIPQSGEQGTGYRPHDNRGAHWVHLFARLKPGLTREEATAAINPLFRAIVNDVEVPLQEAEKLDEAFRTKSLVLEPGAHGQSTMLIPVRDRLGMLLAVSGLVLLLCCANVAGLMLVRGSARSGEMAVRSSMGATRGRLASLLLAESLLLALPAALLSLPVALLTLHGLASGKTGIPPTAFDVDLSLGTALVAIAVAVSSALAFGLFPVRKLIRTEPGKALQAYGVRQTADKDVTRFRMALATVQIALSMALLAITGVFAQSLANIARIDLGLDVDSVVTFSISPEASGLAPEASARLYEGLEEELAAIRGVSSAASSMFPLLSSETPAISGLVVEGIEAEGLIPLNYVSPGFFRTLGIESFAGRDFRATDVDDTPKVAIVNQRFAERFLGGDVIGPYLRLSRDAEIIEIVGLVANAKYGEVTGEIEPQLFLPRRLSPSVMLASATFYVRGARSPDDLVNEVRETVARVIPLVPITDLRTMRQQVDENLATERFVAGTSTAFAVLATLLAGLGLYGVLAYSVAQRSREIGLRFALGAPARRIRWMVLRQVAGIALIGVLLGATAAWFLGRAARSLLFGIEAGDPLALAAAAAVLAAVTLGSAYLPARRASRVDPMVMLRYE